MRDLTQVDGIKVEARARATYSENNRPNPLVKPGTQVPTVDELLMENGSVIYQCVHPSDEDCTFVHANLRSVTAHQTAHGKRRLEREAKEAKAAADAATAELEARKLRRSDGSKKGHVTRMAARATPAAMPTEIGSRTSHQPGNEASSAIGDKELAKMAQNVILAWNALQDCENEFQNKLIGYMRAAQTATEQALRVNPQILAKAKQYDVLKAALNGINVK